jgi:hypothetical protein
VLKTRQVRCWVMWLILVLVLKLSGRTDRGASRIISSVTVFNELSKLPKGHLYARHLFDKVLLFTRKVLHPFRMDSAGTLRTYWNQ